MTDRVYVDTSFLYALVDEGDPGHARVRDTYEAYDGEFLLSTYVLAEVISLVTKRFSKARAIAGGTWIRESRRAAVIQPSAGELEAAWTLFLQRPDSSFDLVDAISFVVMEREALDTVLTLDHHFVQMGFTVLPA